METSVEKTQEEVLREEIRNLEATVATLRESKLHFYRSVERTIRDLAESYEGEDIINEFIADFCGQVGIEIPQNEVQILVQVPIGRSVDRVTDDQGDDLEFDEVY